MKNININTSLISVLAGGIIAFVNIAAIQFASHAVLGISVFVMYYSFVKVANRNKIIFIGFCNFVLISVLIFIVNQSVTFIYCQAISLVSLSCLIDQVKLILIREIIVFYIPWIFVVALFSRKIIIELLASIKKKKSELP